jgi:multiple sugar transport system permease protein
MRWWIPYSGACCVIRWCSAVNVVGQVSIGTVAAACFAGGIPGASTMRGLLFAAWVLPGLVVGTV